MRMRDQTCHCTHQGCLLVLLVVLQEQHQAQGVQEQQQQHLAGPQVGRDYIEVLYVSVAVVSYACSGRVCQGCLVVRLSCCEAV